MDFKEKERLARTNDDGMEAAGIRLKAARLAVGLGQTELGKHGGVSKQAITNMEKARSYPQRPLMSYLFREHRIDFNFLINGDFRQLPSDVQDELFVQLSMLDSEMDRATS